MERKRIATLNNNSNNEEKRSGIEYSCVHFTRIDVLTCKPEERAI